MDSKTKARNTKTQRRQMRDVVNRLQKLKYSASPPAVDTALGSRRHNSRDEKSLERYGDELKQFCMLKKRLQLEREVEAERVKQLMGHPYYLQPKELKKLMQAQSQLGKAEQFERNFLNASQANEAELKESRASMVACMRAKNLLPAPAADGSPDPILWQLTLAFKKVTSRDVPKNKNYFALSLKQFFMNLSADQLDQVCHQFVDGWIKEELTKQNQELKDMIEISNQAFPVHALEREEQQKRKAKSRLTPQVRDLLGEDQLDSLLELPRYMAPTIGNVRKKRDQAYHDKRDLKHHLRNYASVEPRTRMASSHSNGSFVQGDKPLDPKKAWMPTNKKDPSLEADFRQKMESGEIVEGDTQARRSLSAQRAQQQKQLVDRLHKEADSKLAQQRYYADEKIRRETAECTFQPNHERRKKEQATFCEAKRLLVSLYRSDNNFTEIGECKPSKTEGGIEGQRSFNANSDLGVINIETPNGPRQRGKPLRKSDKYAMMPRPLPGQPDEQDIQAPFVDPRQEAIAAEADEKQRKRPFNPCISSFNLPFPKSIDQIPAMEEIDTLPPEADLFEMSDSSIEVRMKQLEVLRKAKAMLSKHGGGSRTDRGGSRKKMYSLEDVLGH